MNTDDANFLLRRMEVEHQRLRRQVRWLTVMLLGSLSLILIGEAIRLRHSLGAPGQKPGELKVSRLIIHDEQGQIRGELGLSPGAQEPFLALYHSNGQRWASLAIAPQPGAPQERQSAALTLLDESGNARVSLGASSQDSGLVLYEPRERLGVALYLDTDSQGLLIAGGDAPRIHLRYTEHDDARLSELIFRDENKRTQATLHGGRGGVSLNLYRPDGQSVFQVP